MKNPYFGYVEKQKIKLTGTNKEMLKKPWRKRLVNRDEIRKKVVEFSLDQVEVYIKEWKTKVLVKELTGEEYLQLSELSMEGSSFSKTKFLTLAIIKSVYSDGELLFTMEDYEKVKCLPIGIYSPLVEAFSKINKIDKSKN